MATKCLICRNATSFLLRAAFGKTFLDTDTEESYCFCPKCCNRLVKGKGNPLSVAKTGVRKAVLSWYNSGAISPGDLDRIEKDSIRVISERYLKTSNPTFGFWINDRYIIADEPSKRILIERNIINFSDIDSYQVFDNAIEYNIQSPNSTQYDFNTKHGLRRTIVGGIIAGPAGAVMGGLTSKHSLSVNEGMKSSYITTEHDFKVLINLKTLAFGGSINVEVGNSEIKLQTLVNLLDKLSHY